MDEKVIAEEASQEDKQDAVALDAATEGDGKELSQDIIDEATKMGWTEKSQFKGDPAKWRPADEFVERGKNMLPIVKATVKRQEKEIAELKKTMQQFGEYHNQTEQRAYIKAMQNLKQQRADAIAKGDGVTFDKVDSEIDRLKQEAEKKIVMQDQNEVDPVYEEWKGRNKWVEDPKLEKYAVKMGEYLRETGVTETGNDFLDMVAKKVKAEFPDKFTNSRRENAAAVEGGVPAARKGGKSFSDLPADARAACDRMAKNAYSADEKQREKFKAEYTKNYFSEVA